MVQKQDVTSIISFSFWFVTIEGEVEFGFLNVVSHNHARTLLVKFGFVLCLTLTFGNKTTF